MIGRLLTGPQLALAAFCVLAACSGAAYLKGRADGRALVEARLSSDRVTILLDGREIDEHVLAADDAGLCALIGGCGLPGKAGGD